MATYLDWNATAPLRSSARMAWLAAQDEAWANPGSIHGDGQRARLTLDEAKRTIARLLGTKPHELVITSGGTEANSLALAQAAGPIAVTAVDHSSILRAAPDAPRLPVDAEGKALLDGLPADAAFVAFQFANNETGVLQDVPGLVAAIRARAPAARIHLDACQGAGKATLDLGKLGVDTASIAGHKFGAPKGIGLLYARNGMRIAPQLRGGRQQQDRRSGTEDPAAAAALAAALTEACAEQPVEDARQRELLDACFARIATALPAARWIARRAQRLANTLSLGHPGIDNQLLVQRLDLRGFAVSVGAACMAGRGEPSHVIAAMGVEPSLAKGVIRVSIGHTTTAAELEAFAAAYTAEVQALGGSSSSSTAGNLGGSSSSSTAGSLGGSSSSSTAGRVELQLDPKTHKNRGWYLPRHLPHFDGAATVQLITYRLADSLPRAEEERIRGELDHLADEQRASAYRKRIEQALDAGFGSQALRSSDNATLVIDAWHHFADERYRLHAWVVMPTHVHVLIEALAGHALPAIVQSWKSFTGRRLTGMPAEGAWQRDYWDRFIRDEAHFHRAVAYIHENPVKAGLCSRVEEWRWSSASLAMGSSWSSTFPAVELELDPPSDFPAVELELDPPSGSPAVELELDPPGPDLSSAPP